MDSSTKRKVGAIALIVAGIGAFLVPFLLHGPALQASSNGGGNTNNNNNNGKTPSGSCTTDCTPPCTSNCSPDTTPPGCTSDPTTNSHRSGDNEGKHLAKGHDKQDKPDTSLVAKAHGFMAALAKHNPQHDATHSTKTDNDTTNSHSPHSNSNDTDDTTTCADNKDNESSDDQGNDD
jgi:hypothetical protein